MIILKDKSDRREYCLECGKIIPEVRLKSFPKRNIITCSKTCSTKWRTNHYHKIKGRKNEKSKGS